MEEFEAGNGESSADAEVGAGTDSNEATQETDSNEQYDEIIDQIVKRRIDEALMGRMTALSAPDKVCTQKSVDPFVEGLFKR